MVLLASCRHFWSTGHTTGTNGLDLLEIRRRMGCILYGKKGMLRALERWNLPQELEKFTISGKLWTWMICLPQGGRTATPDLDSGPHFTHLNLRVKVSHNGQRINWASWRCRKVWDALSWIWASSLTSLDTNWGKHTHELFSWRMPWNWDLTHGNQLNENVCSSESFLQALNSSQLSLAHEHLLYWAWTEAGLLSPRNEEPSNPKTTGGIEDNSKKPAEEDAETIVRDWENRWEKLCQNRRSRWRRNIPVRRNQSWYTTKNWSDIPTSVRSSENNYQRSRRINSINLGVKRYSKDFRTSVPNGLGVNWRIHHNFKVNVSAASS